ncbi:MAG: YtfJ family protein [Epsilonproteobacteria bacterium]|nr:YtfJ family protein [Campylobacterota bacterium]
MKLLFTTLFLFSSLHALQLGTVPPEVILKGKKGGKVDGSAWNSSMLKDKVYVLFYVDPDERNANNTFSEALKAEKFDLDKYGSVAIVNMAATWMPNFAIEKKLKAKQKKYPTALYVKDKKRVLVDQWGLADDSSVIIVFSNEGKILYYKDGRLSNDEISKVITLIYDNL